MCFVACNLLKIELTWLQMPPKRIRNLADLIIECMLKIDSCSLAHETNEDSDDGCESSMLINSKEMSLN